MFVGEPNLSDVNNLLAQVLPECSRCGKALETLRLGFGQKPLLNWNRTTYIISIDTLGINRLGVFRGQSL